MYEQAVGLALFDAHLPCRFEERLALYVADSSSYLGYYDITVDQKGNARTGNVMGAYVGQ